MLMISIAMVDICVICWSLDINQCWVNTMILALKSLPSI
jgi:hypothetical protein